MPIPSISTIISHCITGIDGQTVDPSRVYGALAVLTFFGLSIYSAVVHQTPWDATAYGIGFGALLAGFGAGVQLKKDTEPPSGAQREEERK